jgi:hypothetical protein
MTFLSHFSSVWRETLASVIFVDSIERWFQSGKHSIMNAAFGIPGLPSEKVGYLFVEQLSTNPKKGIPQGRSVTCHTVGELYQVFAFGLEADCVP